jgi:hypothetical protein
MRRAIRARLVLTDYVQLFFEEGLQGERNDLIRLEDGQSVEEIARSILVEGVFGIRTFKVYECGRIIGGIYRKIASDIFDVSPRVYVNAVALSEPPSAQEMGIPDSDLEILENMQAQFVRSRTGRIMAIWPDEGETILPIDTEVPAEVPDPALIYLSN